MKKFAVFSLIVAVAAAVLVIRFWPARHEAVFYPMGGIPFRVITYGRSSSTFDGDVNAAEELVENLENVFSSYRNSSELSRINRDAHDLPFEMSADMRRVIERAVQWWKKTDGAFDITVGPLINLWSAAGKSGELPADADVKKALQSVGSGKIEIADDGSKIRNKASELGLGGIAKGDIVDQVARLLQERGIKRGIAQAGGDTVVFGGGKFRIGIQDPTAKWGAAVIGEVEIPSSAIVTSGNYERFVTIDGKKYSHIIDPKTGMPIDNGLVAATVMGPKCIDADAVATALMVMGRERAADFLRNTPEFKAILIEKKGDRYVVWAPRALEGSLHFEKPWADLVAIY